MKRVLIIGGAGYIGSRLQYEFLNKYDVTSVDLEWYGNVIPLNQKLNYNDATLDDLRPYDVIILLAAYASVNLCRNGGYEVVKNDVHNFCCLFDKIQQLSRGKRVKFIYASSGSIYGDQPYGHLSCEADRILQPQTMYDLCKKFNDDFVGQNHKGVEYYGLRFGTVNGWSPHLRTDIMINSMYHTAKLQGKIHCSGTHSCRAILDIEDLCHAVSTIIESNEDKRGIYNLASFSCPIGEIGYKVAKSMNVEMTSSVKSTSPYSFELSCLRILHAFPTLNLRGSVYSILSQLDRPSKLKSVRN